MSHFTVLVIGQDPVKQLAPYQENNMGDCPKEYLQFNNVEDEYREEYKKPELQKDYPDFDTFMRTYAGYGKDEETGQYGYWDNPNKKWDWYELGGRWTGFFKLKQGAGGVTGKPGLMTESAKPGYTDAAIKDNIDFDGMMDEAAERAGEQWDLVNVIVGHLPPSEPWKVIAEKISDIKLAREAYHSQERVKAFKEYNKNNNYCFGIIGPGVEDYTIPREQYCQQARNNCITTYAVLKDGVWYERGEMGWWGIVINGKEKEEWNGEFTNLIKELPGDTLLSVYDCHI